MSEPTADLPDSNIIHLVRLPPIDYRAMVAPNGIVPVAIYDGPDDDEWDDEDWQDCDD